MDLKTLWQGVQGVVQSVKQFGRRVSRERTQASRKAAQTAQAQGRRSQRRERLGLPPARSTLGMGIGEVAKATPSKRSEGTVKATAKEPDRKEVPERAGMSKVNPEQQTTRPAGENGSDPGDRLQSETANGNDPYWDAYATEQRGAADPQESQPKGESKEEIGSRQAQSTPGQPTRQQQLEARNQNRIAAASGRRAARRQRLGLSTESSPRQRQDASAAASDVQQQAADRGTAAQVDQVDQGQQGERSRQQQNSSSAASSGQQQSTVDQGTADQVDQRQQDEQKRQRRPAKDDGVSEVDQVDRQARSERNDSGDGAGQPGNDQAVEILREIAQTLREVVEEIKSGNSKLDTLNENIKEVGGARE